MEKLRIIQIGLSVGILLGFSMANAAMLGVSGPPSSKGTLATLIQAPAYVIDAKMTSTGIVGFNEAQRVTTTKAFEMDNGVILPAGSFVDSHMIFLNPTGNELITHADVQYFFSGDIIGVMSDINGNLEAASTGELGLDTTEYGAPFSARGMERENDGSLDGYSISGGNVLTVNMKVTTPGDWIRVISKPATTPGTGRALPSIPLLLLNE